VTTLVHWRVEDVVLARWQEPVPLEHEFSFTINEDESESTDCLPYYKGEELCEMWLVVSAGVRLLEWECPRCNTLFYREADDPTSKWELG
jgi:hypothetical protein